uniref:Large ribosomal subunit protein uL10 n=1 Tax=Rhinopithecus bieti TaxID=61621 RepID=A0A2K6KS26_RHIBE
MPRENRATWKPNHFLKIVQLLDDYPKCFVVGADYVGSRQMQQILMSLRGKAVVLMGKNAMMRKALRGHLENSPALEKLLPCFWGNVGFAFTKEDLTEITDMLLASKVPAATHAGAITPCEVTVPAQNTGPGPEKTSFSHTLGITTKIFRGTIECVGDIASVCLQIGYPTVASVPHSILIGYKGVLALSVETDDTFPLAEKVKAFLADPSAFVAAPPVEAKEESEESDEDMGFGLFD